MRVLLTGMPRSGTSLLAKIVARIGLDFGPADALVGPDEWAPDGYYERRDLVELNQHLLSLMGGRNVIPGTGKLPNLRKWAKLEQSILDLVEVAKVPRAAFLLPLFKIAAPDALWVVSVRHPDEVAFSWERAYGVDFPSSLDIWAEYYSRLSELPVGRTLIVSYDGWFTRPDEQMERLCRFLDKPNVRLGDEVKPKHRHTTCIGETGHRATDELYRRLLRCA